MEHKYWYERNDGGEPTAYCTSFSNNSETVRITKRNEMVLVDNAIPGLCLMNQLDFETEKEYREFTGDYSFF